MLTHTQRHNKPRMVKHQYAARGKPKPKSIKSKAKLSAKRKLSRFGASRLFSAWQRVVVREKETPRN